MNRRTIRIIGVLGAIWNAVGVASYLAHVGMFGPEAAATPPGAPAMPIYITAAFAIAVFGGVLGSIGLAMFKSWAKPLLVISFVTSVINWTWVFMYGVGASMPLGVSVIAISLALAIVASRASLTKG